MKEDNALNPSQQKPTWVTPSLTSKWKRTATEGKMMPSNHKSEEDLGEASFATENLADVSVTSSRKPGQQPGLKFAAATEAILSLVVSLLGPPLTRSRLPSGSCSSQWFLMPGLPPRLSQRYPEEMEKEEQAIAGKDITKEECQGEWAAPAPEFTATQAKVETGLQ
ncbi:hypothetical protein EI555_014449, partial [Monodon monoceros]